MEKPSIHFSHSAFTTFLKDQLFQLQAYCWVITHRQRCSKFIRRQGWGKSSISAPPLHLPVSLSISPLSYGCLSVKGRENSTAHYQRSCYIAFSAVYIPLGDFQGLFPPSAFSNTETVNALLCETHLVFTLVHFSAVRFVFKTAAYPQGR